jgi:hypothetical protein
VTRTCFQGRTRPFFSCVSRLLPELPQLPACLPSVEAASLVFPHPFAYIVLRVNSVQHTGILATFSDASSLNALSQIYYKYDASGPFEFGQGRGILVVDSIVMMIMKRTQCLRPLHPRHGAARTKLHTLSTTWWDLPRPEHDCSPSVTVRL